MKRATNRSVNDCFVCQKAVPHSLGEPSPKSTQPKRSVKSRKSTAAPPIDWIKCDICKYWFHAQCCGLNSRDYKKLTSDKQFFKCFVCCLKSAPSSCRTEVLQLVNGEKDSTPMPVAFNTRNEPSELNASTSTSARATNVSQDALCDISEIDTRELNHSVLS